LEDCLVGEGFQLLFSFSSMVLARISLFNSGHMGTRNLVTDPPSFIGPRGSDPALWFTGLSVSGRYSRQRDEGANKLSFLFPSVISVLSLLFIALKADDPEKSHLLMYVFT
jgi:hypothetical protein